MSRAAETRASASECVDVTARGGGVFRPSVLGPPTFHSGKLKTASTRRKDEENCVSPARRCACKFARSKLAAIEAKTASSRLFGGGEKQKKTSTGVATRKPRFFCFDKHLGKRKVFKIFSTLSTGLAVPRALSRFFSGNMHSCVNICETALTALRLNELRVMYNEPYVKTKLCKFVKLTRENNTYKTKHSTDSSVASQSSDTRLRAARQFFARHFFIMSCTKSNARVSLCCLYVEAEWCCPDEPPPPLPDRLWSPEG